MSHCLSLKTLEEDNSVPKVMIRVPDMISSMIALVGNDMSLGGLSELTIYWWNHVGVCKEFTFLFDYGQYGDWRWVIEKMRRFSQVTNETIWRNFLIWSFWLLGFLLYSIERQKNYFFAWGWTLLKQIGFLENWGQWLVNFQNLKGHIYCVLYRRLATINEIFPN